MNSDEYRIRPLSSPADFDACIDLQIKTWGEEFGEEVPPAILKIVQKIGGVCAGAFDRDDRLVGFVFGITGLRDREPVHWSHMLAVEPGLRDSGIGTLLKQYQRDELRSAGISKMYWTFDPLVARNAHLNLNRLGVEIGEYVEDMYPGYDRGKLDAVIGTDRFVAEWNLDQAAQRDVLRAFPERACNSPSAGNLPTEPKELESPMYVEIPADIHELKENDPDTAVAWRRTTRAALAPALAQGYRVAAFGRDDSGRCMYLLRAGNR